MKVRHGIPEDWDPDGQSAVPSIRMALAQMRPGDYELATSEWPLDKLLIYLGGRGLRALLDELENAVEAFRNEINSKL